MFAIRNKQPPCKTCRPEENPLVTDTIKLWSVVSDQWNLSKNGLKTSIMLPAVESAMRMLKIKNKAEELQKIISIARTIARLQAAKADQDKK